MVDQIIHSVFDLINIFFKKIFKKDMCKVTFTQFVKHYMVGSMAVIINYVLFNILMFFNYSIELSNGLTYIVILFFTYFMQRHFTYKAQHFTFWQPVLFFLLTVVYYFLETWLLILMIEKMGVSSLIAKIVSIVGLTPISFFSQKYIIFSEKLLSKGK